MKISEIFKIITVKAWKKNVAFLSFATFLFDTCEFVGGKEKE